MPRLRKGGSRRLMSNPRGGYKCVSAIAAMRAVISPLKGQVVLKDQVVLRSNRLARELVGAPGVNRMIKSAATVSPIPPPRKGEEEIKLRAKLLLGGSA